MEFTKVGVVEAIDPIKGTNDYQNRRIVIAEPGLGGKEAQFWPVKCYSDFLNEVERLEIGDKVKITFEMFGKVWEKKDEPPVYYVQLICRDLMLIEKPKVEPVEEPPEEADDLPF